MKAVIMAGGEGTRLRPLTCGIPKPMVPIAGKPVMEHIIHLLNHYNVTSIAATLCYLPEVITDYFEDGKKFNANIEYFIEDTPLGTGGSVLNTGDFLDDTFLVISGDAITDIDIKSALEFHKSKGSMATLILKSQPIPLEYGIVITNEDGRIIRFLEKPSWGEVFSDTVNTGIYILNPEVFSYYKKGDIFDFSKDLFPRLLKDMVPIYGYVTQSYWSDIGDIKSYMQTNFDVLDGKVKLYGTDDINPKKITISETAEVSHSAIIKPPSYIGKNVVIKDNAFIGAYSLIGDGCVIDEGSTVKRSILGNKVAVGKNSQLRGTIISNKGIIKNNVNIFEGSVVGSETIISSFAKIRPDVKIWPYKLIESETVVNKNLVWGTRTSKTVFGNRDITGDLNIDITPEFSSLLGSAFASVTKAIGPIVITCDNSRAANALKTSTISGILSSGCNVIDCGIGLIPLCRYAVRLNKAAGGIHISSDGIDLNKIHIEIINNKGGNIDRKTEKKIEQLLFREDFERCNAAGTGSIVQIQNFSTLYIVNNSTLVKNIKKIKSTNPHIIIFSSSKEAAAIGTKFLEGIGCKVTLMPDSGSDISNPIDIITEAVTKSECTAGAILSSNGENLLLIDEKGKIIDRDRYQFMSSMIALKNGAKKIIIPYTATRSIDRYASNYNAEVIRTKSSISDFLNEILNIDLSRIPLQYILNFDAILSIGKVIDFLIDEGITLGQLVDEIPKFFIKKQEIECNYNSMGAIIRKIVEINKGKDIELFEGVKLNTDKGWALILPDNEKPVFNIYTEGFTEEFADEISYSITDTLSKLMKSSMAE